MRNLYRYTKLYSGGEPELIEGDVFKTIVPLQGVGAVEFSGDVPNVEVAGKLPDEVAKKLTSAEEAFLSSLMPSFDAREWMINAEVRAATGKSEGSVKRFMRNLTEKGALEARGETKSRQYRLCQRGDRS